MTQRTTRRTDAPQAMRSISFSEAMFLAVREGRKSQTRRLVNPQPVHDATAWAYYTDRANLDGQYGPPSWGLHDQPSEAMLRFCPYGKPGDRLYAKEPLICIDGYVLYAADRDEALDEDGDPMLWKWKPERLGAMYMPRSLSRLTIELTEVRAERVQEISEADVLAEGTQYPVTEEGHPLIRVSGKFPPSNYHRSINLPAGETLSHGEILRAHYASLWESLYGPDSWNRNDWVFALKFKVVT